jgi:hypothetical protein
MAEKTFQNKTVCVTGAGRGLLFKFIYFVILKGMILF